MSSRYGIHSPPQEAPGTKMPAHVSSARRSGIVGWWLNLTAPPVPSQAVSREQAERLRKAELTSLSLIPVLAAILALVSNSLASAATAEALILLTVILIVAAALNRLGMTRTAAYLVPSAIVLIIVVGLLAAPGLRLVGLPIFDMFALPVFIVSLTGDRRAPWVFAFAAIAFIVGDYLLQPHALFIVNGAPFDDIAFEQRIYGVWGMVNRHIVLIFFAAFFGWLGARSVESAIRRADRAEEIASLEHDIAEQKRQLDTGIQEILEVHVRAANGDFAARAPLHQENVLWQVSASLNNMLSRLQRSAQAEFQLRRTDEEIDRLRDALSQLKAGRQPIWPAPTGTKVDGLLEVLVGPARSAPQPPWNAPAGGTGALQPPASSGGQGISGPGWGQRDQGQRYQQDQRDEPGQGFGQMPPNPWYQP